MKRFVLLGASNARRCLPTIFSSARAASGEPVVLYGAIGHGRSYGSPSSVLGRSLPGILECGLWAALETSARDPLDAVVSDAGNDILYGFSVAEILGWVAQCISRLERLGARTTVMGLPVETIERLGPARFLMFRFGLLPVKPPSARTGPGQRPRARRRDPAHRERTGDPLRRAPRRVVWFRPDPYPISQREAAWAEILGAPPAAEARLPTLDALRVRLARPEGESLFGIEHAHAQPAFRAGDGSEIRLY